MTAVLNRTDQEKKCRDLVARARISLIRGRNAPCVFFGTLAMRLRVVIDWSIDTAGVDGVRLFVNPNFWNSLTDQERVGVMCHEVLHCSNKHILRRCGRDMMTWNIACDLAINHIVTEAGMTLPKGGMFAKDFGLPAGKSAEWYYPHVQQQQQQDDDGDGHGEGKPQKSNDPGRCGAVMDGGKDDSTAERIEQEWNQAVGQALEASKGRGGMPASLSINIDQSRKCKVDYWALLRNLMTQNDRADYTWARPNRRHIHTGQYLPDLWSKKMGKIVVTFDTSGSCWAKEILEEFCAQVDGIRQVMPSQIVLLYHTDEIIGEPVITENGEPFSLHPTVSGGTSHVPVFEWIEEHAEDADVVICLTDLYTEFPDKTPAVPVIWVSIGSTTAPFGDVVAVPAGEE